MSLSLNLNRVKIFPINQTFQIALNLGIRDKKTVVIHRDLRRIDEKAIGDRFLRKIILRGE
jgi:hypothetical protein